MLFASSAAFASHQWGSHHWERDGVTVQEVTVGDNHVNNVNTNWKAIFDAVVPDWESDADGGYGGSNFGAVDGGGTGGDVKSFNDDYGNNGWLGLASIWITRGKNKHITRGEAKVNDYYVTLAGYDGFDESVEWEQVMCQEIGHSFRARPQPRRSGWWRTR